MPPDIGAFAQKTKVPKEQIIPNLRSGCWARTGEFTVTKTIRKPLFILAFCISAMSMTTNVLAQEWPLVGGDYWTVTGIEIKDGGDLKYANWLANEWKKNADFAVSKGWLK